MADVIYVGRYDRHCLDKLIGTSTEARLIEEGHIFTLMDGSEYTREGRTLVLVEEEIPAP